MTNNTCLWLGASGQTYTYEVYPLGTPLKALPGNYVFAKANGGGFWAPLYFGETVDFSARFTNHHKLGDAVRMGATHIHVRQNHEGEFARRQEEADLIRRYYPPCNG